MSFFGEVFLGEIVKKPVLDPKGEDLKGSGLLIIKGSPLRSKFHATSLANASLFSASILPLTTAYYICEGMGWEAIVNKNFKDAPQFMRFYTILIAIGALIVLFPNALLILIMWISQVINGVMLPLVLFFMLFVDQ
jgi:Mn2+/Fe2+ NRAMP family transporter